MARPRSAMFGYQQEAVRRANGQDQLALLLEPGDGKTVVTMTSLADRGAWPALVVAPASVVETDVWGAEAREWAHLRGLTVTPLVGTPAQRSKLLQLDSHIEVISYENFRWLTSVLPAEKRYVAMAWDELSKMKDPGSRRFRRARGRSSRIPVRLGLTGTPVGNHWLDLWGEMFMVAGEKALGPTFGDFRDRYFAAVDYWKRVWRLKCCPDCTVSQGECSKDWLHCECHRRAIADIQRRVKPWAFALPPGGGAKKPPLRFNPVRLAMPKRAAEMSQELLDQLFTELPSGAELEALSASAVAGKLRQLASGAVYYVPVDEDGNPLQQDGRKQAALWEEVHTEKLAALDDLLDELQGEPLLVFYHFKHDAVRIKQRLVGRRWVDFATDSTRAADAWNRRAVEVMLMHPQSGGYGLNLQKGGHHVAWFTPPWSGEQFRQGNGRLARPGQLAPWVKVHMLLCGPADEYVEAVLTRKTSAERAFMVALSEGDAQ